MASTKTAQASSNLPGRISWSALPSSSTSRRQSTMSFGTSSGSNISMPGRSSSIFDGSPRVQLVPHAHTHSYDFTLSESDKEILNNTNFDALDLSSKDFDFEDIFTYDRPQRKPSQSAEVRASVPVGEKEWPPFSFSHYSSSQDARSKVQRSRPAAGEMYVKNKSVARKK